MKLDKYLEIAKETTDLRYISVPVSDIDFQGNYVNIHNYDYNYDSLIVSGEVRDAICRMVGMSPPLNKSLYETDPSLWKTVLNKLYSLHSKETILLMIDRAISSEYIKDICQSPRPALSNTEFIQEVINHFEDVDCAEVTDIDYSSDWTTSGVTVLMNNWVTNFPDLPRFKVGVVLLNDEANNSTARLVLKFDNQEIIYFPSKIYNASSSRYDKHTADSKESLRVLLLKVSEDFLTGYIDGRVNELVAYLTDAAKKTLSKSEYDTIRNVIINAAHLSDMDEEEIGAILTELAVIDDYEKLYGSIGSDYLWKSTAFSDTPMSTALKVIGRIPVEHVFYPECLLSIREILGEYLAKPRNCQFIAKRL